MESKRAAGYKVGCIATREERQWKQRLWTKEKKDISVSLRDRISSQACRSGNATQSRD
jgi:hypothetical protein